MERRRIGTHRGVECRRRPVAARARGHYTAAGFLPRCVAPLAQPVGAAESRPFYADPLRLLGWSVALLALAAYWWLFVRRPPPVPGAPIARLTAVEGQVPLRPNAGEAWTAARLSALLHVGDAVQTDARSGAVISFDSGSVVRVRPDTIVFVGGSAESSTAAWRVSAGRVNFAVGGAGEEIATPSTRTRAQANAAGQLDVGDGGTGLKIFSGQAELQTSLGQSVSLSANQAVHVDGAGRAGATLALPPAPSLLAPAPRSTLPFTAPPGAVTTLRWTPAAGAASYRVALDFNVTQAELLLSAALDLPGITGTAHDLTAMDPGRYFWRVAGVTADGLEGAFSRVSLFSIAPAPASRAPSVAPPSPATLDVEALEAVGPGVVRVAGRAPGAAALSIDGVAVPLLPDGSFSEYVRLGARSEVVVRATGRDGRVSTQARRLGGD